MRQLRENQGVPRSLLLMMAVVSGLTVANLYYNQPLLELIRSDLGISEIAANLITVVTQAGYALGLFFIIPMGDLYSRRRIAVVSMIGAAAMAVLIAVSSDVRMVWAASLLLGASSVVPQVFIPIAVQYSAPENKSRNMGIVLSGLLTGILASRVLSGMVGQWLSWRAMFYLAAIIVLACCIVTAWMLPAMQLNFTGSYRQLMHSVAGIFRSHPQIRLNSIRGGFAFGSMLTLWSCLAFHMAGEPFRAGSDMVGLLGLCGIAGAVCAGGIGKYVPRYGVRRLSIVGAALQIAGWAMAFLLGNYYVGLILAIIICDFGLQCQQLSNQSGCIEEIPEASNRVNTIFMTLYFVGGSLGTLCAGWGWELGGWTGVSFVGSVFALCSLCISLTERWSMAHGGLSRG